MKGKNNLYINQATMIDVMQMWVNATFTTPPRVEAVRKNPDDYTGECFVVDLNDPEEQP